MAVFIDGIETAEHTIVAALGVDADGRKHPLGLSEGSTENRTVCQALLNFRRVNGRRDLQLLRIALGRAVPATAAAATTTAA